MKTCFKCGKEKEPSEFYKHPRMSDGHLGKCKTCTRKDVNEHRTKNIDRIREYDRQRGKLPHRIKAMTVRNKIRRKENPIRYAASYLLANAVRDKRITKPKRCSKCGQKTRIMGHHPDYYKPLDVVWLCQVCHIQEHKKCLTLMI